MLSEAGIACFYAGDPAEMLAVAERARARLTADPSLRPRFLAASAVGMAHSSAGTPRPARRPCTRRSRLAESSSSSAMSSTDPVADDRGDLPARGGHRPGAARARAETERGPARRSGRSRSSSTCSPATRRRPIVARSPSRPTGRPSPWPARAVSRPSWPSGSPAWRGSRRVAGASGSAGPVANGGADALYGWARACTRSG